MPPIRNNSAETSGNKEGRIQLALQALKDDPKLSIRRAAIIYSIPRSILHDRANGMPNQQEKRSARYILT